MTETTKDAYEALLTTLLEENNKEVSERDQQYFNDTLNLFNKAGETDAEHQKWRNIDMIQDMLGILTMYELRLNPWKYEVFSSYDDLEQDPEPYINVEKFPCLARKDLELMAAQEYIKKTNNILIPLANPAQKIITDQEQNQTNNDLLEYKLVTEGKKISFSELANILEKYHKTRSTLQRHCARITDDIRAGKKELPCAIYPGDSEIKYAVIAIPIKPKNKTKEMLFQKILDSKED